MSTLRVDNIEPSAGGTAVELNSAISKLWGSATYAAGVPTLVGSLNVTSITDTATGRLVFNATSVFTAQNGPSSIGSTGPQSSGFATDRGYIATTFMQSASTVGRSTWNGSSDADAQVNNVNVLGSLA